MSATDDRDDKSDAYKKLNEARDDLSRALDDEADRLSELRGLIVEIRPLGLLTVGQMAETVSRPRNYIDTVWSHYGVTVKGKQTRVSQNPAEAERDAAQGRLKDAAVRYQDASNTVSQAREARDKAVVGVYVSKVLGPTAIAAAVGVDRNHVLRLARKAGAERAHRPHASNQHTVSK